MKNERLIIKNTAILTVGRALGTVSSLVFIVYFSRTFGAEVLGQYALGMSIGGMLAVFVSLGLNTLMAREVSRDRTKNIQYMGNFLYAQTAMAVIVWATIACGVAASSYGYETKAIILLLGSYHVLLNLTYAFKAQFQAHEKMVDMAALNLFSKFSVLVIGVPIVAIWKEPILAVAVFPVSAFLTLLLGVVISCKRYQFRPVKVDLEFIRRSLFASMPLFQIMLLIVINERVGIIILSNLENETVTGFYSAPDRLIAVLREGLLLFAGALFPTLSRALGESRVEMLDLADKAIRFLIIILFPVAISLYVLSDELIMLIFGEGFHQSVSVLRILSLSIVFDGVFGVVSQILIIVDLQRKVVRLQVLVFVFYLLISPLLIYSYAAPGLAYAKVIASAVLCVAVCFYMKSAGSSLKVARTGIAALVACLAAVVLVEAIEWTSIWLKAATNMGIFFTLLFALKGVTISDLIYLRALFPGKR